MSDMEFDIKQPVMLIDQIAIDKPKPKMSPMIGDPEQPDFSFIFRMTQYQEQEKKELADKESA